MKRSHFYSLGVLVNSIIAFQMDSAVTTTLLNELLRLLIKDQSIAKELNEPGIFDSSLLKHDQNGHRIAKRESKDGQPTGITDVVKGNTYTKSAVKPVTPTKYKPKKTNDLIFDIVKQMIEEERIRRRFDLVHPQNSKFSQQESLLWNKLRIKATEELLLHPKPQFQMPTERVFNNFKLDLEENTEGPAGGSVLFAPLKEKLEKQFQLEKYSKMMGRI